MKRNCSETCQGRALQKDQAAVTGESKKFERETIKKHNQQKKEQTHKPSSCGYLMIINESASGPASGNSAKVLHWLHHKYRGAELGLSRTSQSLGGLKSPLFLYCHRMGCLPQGQSLELLDLRLLPEALWEEEHQGCERRWHTFRSCAREIHPRTH